MGGLGRMEGGNIAGVSSGSAVGWTRVYPVEELWGLTRVCQVWGRVVMLTRGCLGGGGTVGTVDDCCSRLECGGLCGGLCCGLYFKWEKMQWRAH